MSFKRVRPGFWIFVIGRWMVSWQTPRQRHRSTTVLHFGPLEIVHFDDESPTA